MFCNKCASRNLQPSAIAAEFAATAIFAGTANMRPCAVAARNALIAARHAVIAVLRASSAGVTARAWRGVAMVRHGATWPHQWCDMSRPWYDMARQWCDMTRQRCDMTRRCAMLCDVAQGILAQVLFATLCNPTGDLNCLLLGNTLIK